MVVVMKRAERLVSRNPESESLRDPLNRQVAKLLKLNPIHSLQSLFPFKYSSVLEYSPVWAEKVMNPRFFQTRN